MEKLNWNLFDMFNSLVGYMETHNVIAASILILLIVQNTCVLIIWRWKDISEFLYRLFKRVDEKELQQYRAQREHAFEVVYNAFEDIVGGYIPKKTRRFFELEASLINETCKKEKCKVKIRAKYKNKNAYFYITLVDRFMMCAVYSYKISELHLRHIKIHHTDIMTTPTDMLTIREHDHVSFSTLNAIREYTTIVKAVIEEIPEDHLWYAVTGEFEFDYVPHSTIMNEDETPYGLLDEITDGNQKINLHAQEPITKET